MRAEFEAKAKTLKSNVDSLVVGWQKELKIYEKERSKMTKKELALKQELLGNKQQQINNYQQAIQHQVEEEDKKPHKRSLMICKRIRKEKRLSNYFWFFNFHSFVIKLIK